MELRFDKRKEFERMQKMFDNTVKQSKSGKYDHMDLLTYSWNYYNDQVKLYEMLRDFWRADSVKVFFEEERKYYKSI